MGTGSSSLLPSSKMAAFSSLNFLSSPILFSTCSTALSISTSISGSSKASASSRTWWSASPKVASGVISLAMPFEKAGDLYAVGIALGLGLARLLADGAAAAGRATGMRRRGSRRGRGRPPVRVPSRSGHPQTR